LIYAQKKIFLCKIQIFVLIVLKKLSENNRI